MSQDNVELVYRAREAFNQRNLDAFVARTDPEVELIPLYVEFGELGNDDLDGGDGTDSCDQGSGTGLVVNCEP